MATHTGRNGEEVTTTRRKAKPIAIPASVREQLLDAVDRFNQDELKASRCYYQARFRGSYCYLSRVDHGREGPICRLHYKGGNGRWQFAIFKWSTESYDSDEWMFPGSHLVDGTVEGAMRAGLEAYPA